MYNGIVNIYKEKGYTSHDVVARLRGIFGQKKVGHTGTLDPMAEGVLIVLLGQATRLSDILITNDKIYTATMRLGVNTDTEDITGNITRETSASELRQGFAFLSDEQSLRQELEEIMSGFIGDSMQIPPMYSAIKVNGRKLYEYARAGETVERQPRPIRVYSLELTDIDIDRLEISFVVKCSKGTYIRSLIRDIGEKLGTDAVMTRLIREEVNGIRTDDSLRISDIERLREDGRLESAILPIDNILSDVPAVSITDAGLKYLDNGNRLRLDDLRLTEGTALEDIRTAPYFGVLSGGNIRALYSYDKQRNDYKVFKML